MHILCIANEISQSAAGVVFKAIIEELSIDHVVHVLCLDHSLAIENSNIELVVAPQKPIRINWRLADMSATLFGCNVVDLIEYRRKMRKVDIDSLQNVDCILSFVAQQKYFGIMVGRTLSKQLKKKWAIYSVDAIPAPYPWIKSSIKRKSIERFFRKLIKNSDLFMSANPSMLKYQLNLLHGFNGLSCVLYTPSSYTWQPQEKIVTGSPVFLYTGSVYGARRVDLLLKAFRLFIKDYPKAKMIFVGHNSRDFLADFHDLISSQNIECYEYVVDLHDFYDKATVLLDINADIPNDVFLSSKIANYLGIKKPIMCISGDNSPARNIFTSDDSIIHCSYDVNSIYGAMKQAITIGCVPDTRNHYIDMFSTKYACKRLIEVINTI